MDHFLLDSKDYVRDLDLLGNAARDYALMLHKRTGVSVEQAIEYAKNTMRKGGRFEIKNPKTTIIAKDENGDRSVKKVGWLNYVGNIVKKDLICAPSMTTYIQPSVRESELGVYINKNLGLRSAAKHAKFEATMAGNVQLAEIKECEQTSHKIFNNAISGLQAIGSTPMCLPSAHSSLTSGCRSATSYGNATIERFVAGSRHYWSAEVVKTNIYSIIGHTDYTKLQATLDKFGLRCPTTEEIMELIEYSTQLYWRSEKGMKDIHRHVKRLTPLERAAFAYTGDFYHLRKFNDEFARQMVHELSRTVKGEHPDPKPVMKKMKGDYLALVTILCADVTTGRSINKVIEENDLVVMSQMALTYENLMAALDKYHDVISTFWTTRNMPSNISKTRDIVRRSVVASDTDSCMFSVREWVQWKNDRATFDEECQSTWHTLVFMTCQVITHTLTCLSAGMGVRGEGVKKLAMKNEYAYPVFVRTNRAKHYYAYCIAQEGNVFAAAKRKLDTKGVGFVDSNAPPAIVGETKDYLLQIVQEIYDTGHLNVMPYLKSMADTEREVTQSIRRGEPRYLKTAYVNTMATYKKPMASNYFSQVVWENTFFHKYGGPESPPWRGVRVSLDLPNKTSLKAWVDRQTDPIIKEGLTKCYLDTNKNGVASIILPLEAVEKTGVPEEILDAANIRKLTFATVSPFYLVQDSLGVGIINGNLTRLISDMIQ